MLILNSKELVALNMFLKRISEESEKPVQRKFKIYNMIQKVQLIIKKAERRQKNKIDF